MKKMTIQTIIFVLFKSESGKGGWENEMQSKLMEAPKLWMFSQLKNELFSDRTDYVLIWWAPFHIYTCDIMFFGCTVCFNLAIA